MIMTQNQSLMYEALTSADQACMELTELRDKLKDVFGEESPICKKLQSAIDWLGTSTNICYELFGGNFAPRTEEGREEVFTQWIKEE